jgi:hypothetical protein
MRILLPTFLRNSSVIASAVVVRPTVELRVGEFDVLGAHRFRHLQNLIDVIDVQAMQHAVEHHRVVVVFDELGDFVFEVERLGAADEVVQFLGGILERKLDVIESRVLQRFDARFV